MGSRCPACGHRQLPARAACPACRAETETVAMADEGTVLARTRRPGHPWVALVALDDGGRVLAASEGAPEQAVPVGARVRLTVDGPRVRFAPAQAPSG